MVAAQSDEQSRARNKRMFGSLLGTLNKFCSEESRLKGRVEKKAIIEKKVEEQELRERETIKQERRNLFIDRKKRLMEVRLLEIKMERMQDLAVFEEGHKRTRQFIRTTAGPKIFFLPKHMNDKTTKLLEDSQRQYDGTWILVVTQSLTIIIPFLDLSRGAGQETRGHSTGAARGGRAPATGAGKESGREAETRTLRKW